MRDATNHHANGRDTDRTHGATPRTHGATPPRHLTSPSHGDVTIREACELIAEFVLRDPETRYVIGIGTDSQNYDFTKMVTAMYAHRVGQGAIAFYDVQNVPYIRNIHRKMLMETGDSIALADEVLGILTHMQLSGGRTFNLDDHDVSVELHCDIGTVGPSREVIREVVGWVESCGYTCKIKPESHAATSLANRISK